MYWRHVLIIIVIIIIIMITIIIIMIIIMEHASSQLGISLGPQTRPIANLLIKEQTFYNPFSGANESAAI